jgi:GT2 family glycosyltransferase
MSFRRAVFEAVGGVNGGYVGTEVYNETDFSCRVRALGHQIRFEPAAEILHLRAPRGGCAQRTGSLRTPYSLYHNAILFALRCMPWKYVPRALIFRLRQARKDAFAQKRPAHLVIFPIAVAHGVFSWLKTGKERYTVPIQ